jgi:hypothetical protein
MEIARWLKTQWDRTAAVVATIVGLVLIGIGWSGISRSTLVTQQIPYLASGGLLGIFLLGAAATLWLSADLRDEWRKLDDIHRALESDRPSGRGPAVVTGGDYMSETRSSPSPPKTQR